MRNPHAKQVSGGLVWSSCCYLHLFHDHDDDHRDRRDDHDDDHEDDHRDRHGEHHASD